MTTLTQDLGTRTVVLRSIPEQGTPVMRFTIVDKDLQGFKPTKLFLTLFNYKDGSIINNRLYQDVLDNNGVTVSAAGVVEWHLSAKDSIIVVENDSAMSDSRNIPTAALFAKGLETHIALFEWEWNTADKNSHEIEHRIQARTKIPGILGEADVTMGGVGSFGAVGATI